MFKLIKRFILIFVFLALFTAIVGGFFLVSWIKSIPIPDFETFDERKIAQSTKIYDRTGEKLLYDIHNNIKRKVVSYEDISIDIKNATVAIEDSEYYQHKGISITGIIRALLTNLSEGRLRGGGGSTITQQLVKNSFLTPEKTFARKIKEAILSIKMEKNFSKEKILTLYLNENPYGGSIYGVEEASFSFFGKRAKDVTLAEAAYLAALPQAPSYYSPYGINKDKLDDRKNIVLKRMLDLGFIEEVRYEEAKKEDVLFLNRDERGIQAPHFVMFIKSYIEKTYGKDAVENSGLKIVTTIDLDLQKEAEKMVEDYIKEIEGKFNAKNAGMIGIDPKTGQILVMVGSRNYFDENYEGKFNVTLGKRQPGSSFKPFVYATAFKEGYTPETVVFDLKTEFNASCNPDGTPKPGINSKECYQPGNYDNIYRGPVSFRDALAQSINIPAVKVLYLAGLKDSLQTAKDLGITTLGDPSRYGLTLVLGGGETTLLEMTGAYSVFANDGVKNPITGILKIEDSKGNTIEEFKSKSINALDSNVARTINDILKDNDARAPSFGQESWLYFPEREVAVKTGTTNDYRDAWVIGYTPNFSLGLWVGNNDNLEMEKKVAGFIAAPLWNEFFKKVFEKLPEESFPEMNKQTMTDLKPILRGYWQGGISYFIDKMSGKLATEFTPEETKEEKILTQIHSILYWIDRESSQFVLWEDPVRQWAKNQNIKEQTEDDIPKEYDDIHTEEYQPIVKIISPQPNDIFQKSDDIIIKIETSGHFPIMQVDFYLNDFYLGSISPPIYEFYFNTDNIPIINEKENIRINVIDQMKNKKEYILPISFQ